MQIGTVEVRSFLSLYDELLEKEKTMKQDDFIMYMMQKCAEYNQTHPKTSPLLIGMQLHFQNHSKGSPSV